MIAQSHIPPKKTLDALPGSYFPMSNFKLPDWVPEAARLRIIALNEDLPSGSTGRDVLKRLATDLVMRTEVWDKLPKYPLEQEGKLIDFVIEIPHLFSAKIKNRVPTSGKAKIFQYGNILGSYKPAVTFDFAISLSMALTEQIIYARETIDNQIANRWEGEEGLTADLIIERMLQLSEFLRKLSTVSDNYLNEMPPIRRPFADDALRIFFSTSLSDRFLKTYGTPLDGVVAAITQVVFDDAAGVDSEAVRGRRRAASDRRKLRNI